MREGRLGDMERGWFVGNFEPSMYRTGEVEVAVKRYRRGEREGRHLHKVADELTVVVSGRVRMFGREYGEGDIVVAEAGDATGFEAVTDAVSVVVKIPGASGDKYMLEGEEGHA